MDIETALRNATLRRLESGATTTAIAEGAGVPRPSLSRWLAGKRSLTLTTAWRLAEYLGLELTPRKR